MENIPIGAVLDAAQMELEQYIGAMMQRQNIPASLMDKVIDGVQSCVRQQKAEEYAACIANAHVEKVKKEVKTGTQEELREAIGKGAEKCMKQ